jgi:hypothetical protein
MTDSNGQKVTAENVTKTQTVVIKTFVLITSAFAHVSSLNAFRMQSALHMEERRNTNVYVMAFN